MIKPDNELIKQLRHLEIFHIRKQVFEKCAGIGGDKTAIKTYGNN